MALLQEGPRDDGNACQYWNFFNSLLILTIAWFLTWASVILYNQTNQQHRIMPSQEFICGRSYFSSSSTAQWSVTGAGREGSRQHTEGTGAFVISALWGLLCAHLVPVSMRARKSHTNPLRSHYGHHVGAHSEHLFLNLAPKVRNWDFGSEWKGEAEPHIFL